MTIREYIEGQDARIRPRLHQVWDAISAAIPEAEQRIAYGMPTFWKGRNIIHFAAMKRHIGIYPGPAAVEAFRDRLVGYKTSKGAIQLPNDQPLPLELVAEIARWSCAENGK